MPTVFIVILNWNGLADTLDCLETVFRLDYPRFRVLVVDNGSTDGSAAVIRRRYPQAIVLELATNRGYTGGNNAGMAEALRQGADYVWLLNNDTEVAPGALAGLVRVAEASPQVGLVAPVVYYHESPATVQYIGATIDFSCFRIDQVRELECLAADPRNLVLFGTALMIRRGVIERIGGLDEHYFAYQEDFQYSLRVLRAGFATAVSPDSTVLHKDSRSTGGNDSPIRTFFMARNAYFLWRENLAGLAGATVPLRYFGMMIGQARLLLEAGNTGSLAACLQGVWAAFTGRGGRYDPALAPPGWFRALFGFFVAWHPYFWANLFRGNLRGLLRDLFGRSAARSGLAA